MKDSFETTIQLNHNAHDDMAGGDVKVEIHVDYYGGDYSTGNPSEVEVYEVITCEKCYNNEGNVLIFDIGVVIPSTQYDHAELAEKYYEYRSACAYSRFDDDGE